MGNIIVIITIWLFGKMIYWMYENRNNLGSKIKALILNVIGVILGICLYLLGMVAFVYAGVSLMFDPPEFVRKIFEFIINFAKNHGDLTFTLLLVLFIYRFSKYTPDELDHIAEELHQNEIERRRQERKEKHREIDELERERSYIKRSNNILDDLTGSGLSKSELRQNQKLYDKMGREIQDKRRELED